MSQTAAILEVLSDRKPHSVAEIHSRAGTSRLNSRISDLRAQGYVIDCWTVKGRTSAERYVYRLLFTPELRSSLMEPGSLLPAVPVAPALAGPSSSGHLISRPEDEVKRSTAPGSVSEFKSGGSLGDAAVPATSTSELLTEPEVGGGHASSVIPSVGARAHRPDAALASLRGGPSPLEQDLGTSGSVSSSEVGSRGATDGPATSYERPEAPPVEQRAGHQLSLTDVAA